MADSVVDEPEATVRVLHVDDEPAFATLAVEFLTREDARFEIETEELATDALDRLERERFDCIISDYDMPEMNGLEFLDVARERFADIPFILFTGKGSEEVASEAIAAGVTDYLQKQAGVEQYELLAHRIQNAVDQYRSKARAADLERVRNLIRDINQVLVHASSRAEVETAVCEIISEADPYLFAWIGEHDPNARTVGVRTGAGIDQGYLDTIEVTTDDSATGKGPTGTAVRTRRLAVMQDIMDTPEYEPWREEALERGYRSSAAIPLVHQDNLYGVLNVYADRREAFDERERDLLNELGDDIAQAIYRHEELEHQEQRIARLEALFEESPDMIDVHDANGTIVDANPLLVENLGYAKDELIGMQIWDVDQRAEPEEAKARLADMDIGDRLQIEGRYRRKDGSTFPVDVHVRRLDVAEGRRYLVISRDISEQIERERTLKEQNERLEQFAGVVSHDLRNPLSTAIGYLDLAREENEWEHLDRVSRNLDRMERIIGDVLWLAREGEGIGSTESVDLQEAVDASWAVVAGRGSDDGPIVPEDETLGRITADYDRLRQLLENVLANALEHGGADVTVRVESLPDGFAVIDDGPGIPAERQDRIFDIDYSTSGKGTGFGLHIVKQIADAHGWDIRVTDSDAGGTRLEFTGVDAG